MNMLKLTVAGDAKIVKATQEDSLQVMQGVVGGHIEVVPLPAVYRSTCTMFANEEGLLKNLPINSLASAFANQVVRGDVIFAGPPGPEGETTDVPKWLVDWAKIADAGYNLN